MGETYTTDRTVQETDFFINKLLYLAFSNTHTERQDCEITAE